MSILRDAEGIKEYLFIYVLSVFYCSNLRRSDICSVLVKIASYLKIVFFIYVK